MSLQLAAQHIAHKGRGPDTTLVHMSRDEVKGLNDLAMAHGGQLTINPETGLPEAGFLSAILPMVAGAALASTGVGAPMAAALIGGGSYLMNPKAGLMGALSAGMGAYGGYGLGEGLTSLGATSETGLTSTGGSMDYATQNAETIKNAQLAEQAKLAQTAQANAQALENAKYFTDYGAPVNEFAQVGSGLPTSPGGMEVAASTPARPIIGADYEHVIPRDSLLRNPLTENQLGQSATGFDTMGRGIKSLATDPTGEKFKTLGGGSYMGLAQKGLMAASPLVAQQTKFTPPSTSATSGKQVVPHYRFTPGMATPTPKASATGVENTYFPGSRYTALSDAEAQQLYPGYANYTPAADGGLMGYAGGGPVEAMSNANAIGANTGFPQAYLHNNAYATPYQTPISQNVLTGAGDVSVDPYTGEQRMAAGGSAIEDPYRTTPDDTLETVYTKAQEKNDTRTMRVLEREMDIRNTNKAGMTQGLRGMKGLAAGGVSYDPQTQRYTNTGGIADAYRPENTDVDVYNDTGGPATGGGPTAASSGSSSGSGSTGQGVSNTAQSIGLGMMGIGSIPGLATGLVGAIGQAIADSQMDSMANANAAMAAANAGGHSVSSDASGNVSVGPGPSSNGMGVATDGTDSAPSAPSGGESSSDGEARGGLSPRFKYHMATGGLSDAHYNLGGYSDGGRLLRGPGDGVSDSIPAVIGKKQPARLADGEFVVPARIVSELGNGSTEAGARKLYAMMDRIQASRKNTVGKGKVAKNNRADKYLPA